MKTEILGVNFDTYTPPEALQTALEYINGDKPRAVFTPNPELVMEARKDSEFKDILNGADMVVPDGIGIVYASKLNKNKIKQRVTGYDLVQSIFREIKSTGNSVYFFGSAPGVADAARLKMEEEHDGLRIVGVADGYFNENREREIIDDIKAKKPDILLVGLGFPKQEKWIWKHKDELGVKLYMGVGGSFDGMAGTFKRAPAFFRKTGLEWFYRLAKQPSRFKRQLKLPLFALIVLKEKLFGTFNKKT